MGSMAKLAERTNGKTKPALKNGWERDKARLLRTHPGWFVAYHKGRRVALEPSAARLVGALARKLGVPRKPCEFHEVVERPAPRRGPSPRLKPADARG